MKRRFHAEANGKGKQWTERRLRFQLASNTASSVAALDVEILVGHLRSFVPMPESSQFRKRAFIGQYGDQPSRFIRSRRAISADVGASMAKSPVCTSPAR